MKTNRRNFLKSIGKICAVLPFMGNSPAVAKIEATGCKSDAELALAKAKLKEFDEQVGRDFAENFPSSVDSLEDGLKEAFCYGGKLFRVFPRYFDEGYVMMSIREGRYGNNRMITKFEFADIQFRHFNCEIMLKDMEKFRKNGTVSLIY